MIWKSLAAALIGLAATAWLGQRNAASGCGSRPSNRCLVDIHYSDRSVRYADRAADLVVVTDDISF